MEKPSPTSEYRAPVVMPFTSSWKKKAIREDPAHRHPARRRDRSCPPRRRAANWVQPSAGQPITRSASQPGISRYLPDELILNRKNLPLTTSPLGVNLIGCPRIVVASFVCLIAASTLLRLGVLPDLQTEAIASSITCVAANTGGPNVPNDPYFALAAATIAASAGIPVMSGPNEDTYEPLIVNVPGENRPSVPKITAFLCCWARLRPNCCAFVATCQGSTTTDVVGVTLATSEEKSVSFCETDSWSTLMPAAVKIGVIAATRPVE